MDFHLWLCANKSYVVAFFPQVLYVSQAEHIEIARWMKRLGTLQEMINLFSWTTATTYGWGY